MSNDPAVEAARRAHPTAKFDQRWVAIATAREALKPIREWSERNRGASSVTDDLLDSLDPLIYPEAEL